MDWLDCLTSVSHLHSSRKNKQLNVNIRTRNIQVRMRESSVTWELSSADFDDLLHVRVFLRLSMSASCPPGSYLKNFTYFNVLRALSKVKLTLFSNIVMIITIKTVKIISLPSSSSWSSWHKSKVGKFLVRGHHRNFAQSPFSHIIAKLGRNICLDKWWSFFKTS